jgi:hypothetical protein
MSREGIVLTKETLCYKSVVEQHFKNIIRVIMEKYNSLPVTSWIFTQTVQTFLPVFY